MSEDDLNLAIETKVIPLLVFLRSGVLVTGVPAYEANDSGQFEIWVRPFPDVNTGRWLVSTSGGTRPLWSRNGQELFYVSPAGALIRVGVTRGPSWAGSTPALLVKDNGYYTGGDLGRSYDISADGQRGVG